jgi:kynureninase
MRPIDTGWFAEFGELEETTRAGEVAYGRGGRRFAGATYDPTSHYRAGAVFRFHTEQGLSPEALRALSQQQTSQLVDAIDALDLDPSRIQVAPMARERRAGFVALQCAEAARLARALAERGVWCDARGSWLRLGPAPYVTGEQLASAAAHLAAVVGGAPPDPAAATAAFN